MLQAIDNNLSFGFSTFTFGGRKMLVVSDGDVLYDNSCFAPDILRSEFNDIRQGCDPYIKLAHNILVFFDSHRIILIDAGNGYASTPEGGNLINNLRLAGIRPEAVTDVVLTHAHPDHIGGLVDSHHELVFPAAAIHISQDEYDFWQSDVADFSKSKSSMGVLEDVQSTIKQILAVVRSQLYFFNNRDLLFGFLQPIPAIGHTPGHYMFKITTEADSFCHMADICHEEKVLFSQPTWGTVFDIDFCLAAQTRIDVLNGFAESGQLVFGYHMPWPGFGRVVREGGGFAWSPTVMID
jgi:glyoxylase-like metal-dependent hydrolase (beta-lactamase superfamily II)